MAKDLDNYLTFNLVLICGNRRSGTTLLNNILCRASDTNPQIAEIQPLTHLLSAFAWSEANYDRMTQYFFRDRAAFDEFRQETCNRLLDAVWQKYGRPKHLVLKNPELSFHASQLMSMWPAARLLACTRDPRDQIASEVEVIRRRPEYGEPGGVASIPELCASFARYFEPLYELSLTKPDRVRTVRYEDWITGGEKAIEGIAEFCRLEIPKLSLTENWPDPAALLDRLMMRPSASELYGRALSIDRIGKYMDTLKLEEVGEIEMALGILMKKLGYKLNVNRQGD